MFNQTDLSTIQETVEEFFKKLTFEVEVEVLPQTDQAISINIKAEEPQILIGERGETLAEIQHFLKLILRRKTGATQEPFYLDIDINEYKKKKSEYLREMAKEAADEVALTRSEKTLPPMSAYERRIVHLELAGRNDVVSESIGQEPERRIVIRPVP